MERALDSRIEQLSVKIEDVRNDLKEDILIVRSDVQDFKRTCTSSTNSYDTRIRDLELWQSKVYGMALGISIVGGLAGGAVAKAIGL